MKKKAILIVAFVLLFLGCTSNGPCPDKSDFRGGKPPNGTELWCEKTMPSGEIVLDGPYTSWHTKDQMKSKGQYNAGEKDGAWTNWHKNGNKRSAGTFKMGKLEGHWTNWYKNGQKQMEGPYVNGKRNGTWNGWFESGEKRDVGDWKDNEPIGKWTYIYKNGNKRQEGVRGKGGKPEGLWVYYYKNGKKKEEGHHKAGKKVGVWKKWDEAGKETTTDMNAKTSPTAVVNAEVKPAEKPKKK